MAFNKRNLSFLSHANGFTLWHYTTGDNIGDVANGGYFDACSDDLRVGDMIIFNTNNNVEIVSGGIFLVKANIYGSVGVVNLTPIDEGCGE